MNKEDIIRLAREAGLSHFYDSEGHCTGVTDARLCTEEKERDDDRLAEILAPFAALIEEHLKSQGYRQCAKGQRTTQFCGMVEQAVQAERKRIIDMLLDMHAQEERHNYYGFIANIIKESA